MRALLVFAPQTVVVQAQRHVLATRHAALTQVLSRRARAVRSYHIPAAMHTWSAGMSNEGWSSRDVRERAVRSGAWLEACGG
jgi:DNA-binding transcriptional MocR family regulator